MDGGDGSFAGGDLGRASVDGADVSDHVGLNGILSGLGVLSIHHNPGDVGMSRDKVLSGDCHLHQVVHTGLGGSTSADGVPIDGVLLCALLSLGSPVSGVGLEADDEGQGLGVLVVELEGAGLNEVSLTLPHTMLTGEGPAGAIGGTSGITIGVKVELADLPEVSSVGSCLEGTLDVLLAVGTE